MMASWRGVTGISRSIVRRDRYIPKHCAAWLIYPEALCSVTGISLSIMNGLWDVLVWDMIAAHGGEWDGKIPMLFADMCEAHWKKRCRNA